MYIEYILLPIYNYIYIYTHIYICMYIHIYTHICMGFPGGTVVKNLLANAGDTGDVGSVHGLRRSPGEQNDYPLQYSGLENPRDRGA